MSTKELNGFRWATRSKPLLAEKSDIKIYPFDDCLSDYLLMMITFDFIRLAGYHALLLQNSFLAILMLISQKPEEDLVKMCFFRYSLAITKWLRDCAIITWRGGGGAGNWVKYAPKLRHTPPLIKKKLISIPPQIMIILRLTPLPLRPPWKKVSSHWFLHT